jgi:hypothetical protein
MKRFLLVAVAFICVASLAFAQGEKTVSSMPAATETVTLKGVIIDNKCASAQKPEALAEFVKTHTKECALQCASSGFSIFADGKLYKLDAASNPTVEAFLMKTDSKTAVEVVAKKRGEELTVVSIQNQM